MSKVDFSEKEKKTFFKSHSVIYIATDGCKVFTISSSSDYHNPLAKFLNMAFEKYPTSCSNPI